MNNLSSKLAGLLLIAIGIGYLGDQLDIWSFTIFFRGWWTLLLAIWGIFNIVEKKPNIFNKMYPVKRTPEKTNQGKNWKLRFTGSFCYTGRKEKRLLWETIILHRNKSTF